MADNNMNQEDKDLWTAVRTQGQAIIGLEANQKAINENMKSMAVTLAALSEKVTAAATTKWDNIWQAAGVALTVAGFMYFIVVGQIDDLNRAFHDHDKLLGHPHSVIEKIISLNEKMELRFDLMDARLDERREEAIRELDALKQHADTEIQRARDRLEYLERRTGRLYKDGVPY